VGHGRVSGGLCTTSDPGEALADVSHTFRLFSLHQNPHHPKPIAAFALTDCADGTLTLRRPRDPIPCFSPPSPPLFPVLIHLPERPGAINAMIILFPHGRETSGGGDPPARRSRGGIPLSPHRSVALIETQSLSRCRLWETRRLKNRKHFLAAKISLSANVSTQANPRIVPPLCALAGATRKGSLWGGEARICSPNTRANRTTVRLCDGRRAYLFSALNTLFFLPV